MRSAMARRIDYYDDPAAPAANSLVPSVNVIIEEDDRILMIRRTDNGNWAVPGGAIDLGESMVQAAVRETAEETGVTCEVTGLSGIYTDPRHVIHYTSNDEVRQEFCVVLMARWISGEPTPSSESSEVRWVDLDDVPDLQMDRSMSRRMEDYILGDLTKPYLG